MTMRRRFAVLVLGLFAAMGQIAPIRAADGAPTVLVTGANRGIGLEFVRQYAARGWRVIATARDPAGAHELQALAADNANAKATVSVVPILAPDQVVAVDISLKGFTEAFEAIKAERPKP